MERASAINMSSIKTLALLLGVTLSGLLAGCQSLKAPAAPTFYLAPSLAVTVPRTVCSADMTRKELLRFTFEGKTRHLLTVATCKKGQLTIEGLLPMGARLFTIVTDGQRIEAKTHLPVPVSVDPAQVLGDYLIANLPLDAWQGRWPVGVEVRDTALSRTVTLNGKPLETVTYRDKNGQRRTQTLIHHRFGYRIDIKPLD